MVQTTQRLLEGTRGLERALEHVQGKRKKGHTAGHNRGQYGVEEPTDREVGTTYCGKLVRSEKNTCKWNPAKGTKTHLREGETATTRREIPSYSRVGDPPAHLCRTV